MTVQLSQYHLLERLVSSILNSLGTLVKNRLIIVVSLPYISNEPTSFLLVTFSTGAIIFDGTPGLELCYSLL